MQQHAVDRRVGQWKPGGVHRLDARVDAERVGTGAQAPHHRGRDVAGDDADAARQQRKVEAGAGRDEQHRLTRSERRQLGPLADAAGLRVARSEPVGLGGLFVVARLEPGAPRRPEGHEGR